jgi:hypothetical protein
MNGIEDHSRHRFGVGNQVEVRSAVEFGDGGLCTRRRKRIIMGSDFPHVEGLAEILRPTSRIWRTSTTPRMSSLAGGLTWLTGGHSAPR